VASVILGALAALGITFFLGYSMGQRVQERPLAPPPVAGRPPADPLAALDQSSRPDGGEPAPKLFFHEALTSKQPPAEKLPAPPPKPAAPAPAAKVAAAVAPAPAPRGAVTAALPQGTAAPATSAGAAAPPPAPPAAAPQPAQAPPKVARSGAFVVQVGSTQDPFEAERLALKFRGRGAKVTSADVPGKGRWYRVRLGAFESREAADRYLQDFEKQTGSKGFVTTASGPREPP